MSCPNCSCSNCRPPRSAEQQAKVWALICLDHGEPSRLSGGPLRLLVHRKGFEVCESKKVQIVQDDAQ